MGGGALYQLSEGAALHVQSSAADGATADYLQMRSAWPEGEKRCGGRVATGRWGITKIKCEGCRR